MNLRVSGWTERMVVASLAEVTDGSVAASANSTEGLFMGYWLQRHGLSDADKQEVVDACRRLESAGLLRRPDGGNPSDPETVWELTTDGVAEVTDLHRVFAKAL